MRWRKYDFWKASIFFGGVLLLLVLMTLVTVSAADAHEGVSGSATLVAVTVQATPTEDATVTALNKEKLAQEVQQLKNQNNPDLLGWFRMNAAILLSTLVVVIGGLIGLFRWFGDRRSERGKQAEARFQSAVTGLGDDKEGAKIGAAILLRTFLRPGYEQLYSQTFDLAVANLRLPRAPQPPADPDIPLSLTTLSQALIVVFKESFPLARLSSGGSDNGKKSLQSLDATGIQLDHAYLKGADLRRVWMPRASLRNVDLSEANLTGANLTGANLTRAYLVRANLHEADLIRANLNRAILSMANLSKAPLLGANLREAVLSWVNLREANLTGADLTEAKLFGANLSKAHLYKANFHGAYLRGANLGGANLEDAISLKDTDLLEVKGLTKEQLEACKARGAIIDKETTADTSQAPSAPSQSHDTLDPSAPPAQVNTPAPSTDGSSSASSQPGTGL